MWNKIFEYLPCFTKEELQIASQVYDWKSHKVQQEEIDASSPSGSPISPSPTDTSSSAASASQHKINKRRPPLNYRVDFSLIPSSQTAEKLRSLFVQSHLDEETSCWLRSSSHPSSFKQGISDLLVKAFGRTSANGLTFRGGMFVFSTAQILNLFEKSRIGVSEQDRKIMDENSIPQNNESQIMMTLSGKEEAALLNSVATRYGIDDDENTTTNNQKNGDENENDDENNSVVPPQPHEIASSPIHKNSTTSSSSSAAATAAATATSVATSTTTATSSFPTNNNTVNVKNDNIFHSKETLNLLSQSSLFDIGAGDGGVTQLLNPFLKNISVSEDNDVMKMRLRMHYGYNNVYTSEECGKLLSHEEGYEKDKNFDIISLLNVLDRCDKPMTLLRDIRQHLVTTYNKVKKEHEEKNKNDEKNEKNDDDEKSEMISPPLLLCAVVLPFCPFVESGSKQVPPSEKLYSMIGSCCCDGASFEKSFATLIEDVIEPAGWKLKVWTRVPYLSEGDEVVEYFSLDDCLMLLEPVL